MLENAERFGAMLAEDASLRERFVACEGPEEALGVACEAAGEMTIEELYSILGQGGEDAELDLDSLGDVAGGVVFTYNPNSSLSFWDQYKDYQKFISEAAKHWIV